MERLRAKSQTLVAAAVVLFAVGFFTTRGYAQEVGLAGTIVDSTDAVLPGVVITAVHVDTGTNFAAVTDGSGVYFIGAMRPGTYTVTAELSGFATVTREDLTLLVGQRAVVDVTMSLSTVEETVTVTGEAPLVDFRQSRVAGVIDSRQMDALPINGRNWMELTLLLPGARRNDIGDSPAGNVGGASLMTMDGQQVSAQTSYLGGIRQPRFSRETIAEFEMVTARFDATKGKSQTVQVNTISKSGTNTASGSVYGFFRDDAFDAADHVVGEVLPYQNQQVGATFGGPLVRDKAHFFANYEYEREPQSKATNNPVFAGVVPGVLESRLRHHLAGARVDVQLNDNRRLMGRWNIWDKVDPIRNNFGTGTHPSGASKEDTQTGQAYGKLTQVFGNSSLLELSGGVSYVTYNTGPAFDSAVGFPRVALVGYNIGAPEDLWEHEQRWSIRSDFSTYRSGHELKLGGEFQLPSQYLLWPSNFNGRIDAQLGRLADVASLFPVWDDPRTWNYDALTPVTRWYTQAFGDREPHCIDPGMPENCRRKKPEFGFFVQDNWQVSNRLVLNLGLRWDFALDGMANDFVVPPLLPARSPQEWNQWQPRLGFAYTVTEKTVVRGGFGKYYAGACDCYSQTTARALAIVDTLVPNDGRATFAGDPYNIAGGGRVPTFEEVLAQVESVGRTLPGFGGVAIPGHTPFSYQTTVGMQRELGPSLSLQTDYTWIHGENQRDLRNVNIAFDPATGVNYPFSDPANRPYPTFGPLRIDEPAGYSNLHSFDVTLSKRFSNGWSASGTYTLSSYKNWIPDHGIFPGCEYPFTAVTPEEIPQRICNRPVQLAPDFAASYTYGAQTRTDGTQTADQRHRLVFNGVAELPGGLSVSGLYSYGSGEIQENFFGIDLRDAAKSGIETFSTWLRFDGSIIDRNSFRGQPVHRVDLRIQERIPVGSDVRIDIMLEFFNLFNRANFGSYQLVEVLPTFGDPQPSLNPAYVPRRMQLGFRINY